MNRSRLITAATTQAVTVPELALHLNLGDDYADQESDLGIKLAAAISIIEEAAGRRQLCQSTWELRLCQWPCEIELDVPQVSSVTSIKYTDASDNESTFDSSSYGVFNTYDLATAAQVMDRAKIILKYSHFWPTVVLQRGEPIAVRYVAGWADNTVVPYPLKAAILLEAGHLYRNRESITTERIVSAPLARGVDSLIAPYRVWGF